MIDLHTHTLLSDGELLPAELIRRAEVAGCRGLAITDHADPSNLDWIVPRIVRACRELQPAVSIQIIPGVELTHLPPALIGPLADRARQLGAIIVVVHGETLAEPVSAGTNAEAIAAGADILAHPGLISEQEVIRARDRGVFLEITARAGHSLSNGHVARLAKRHGAGMVLNTDTHQPADLISRERGWHVARGAGLEEEDFERMLKNSGQILSRSRNRIEHGG